MANFPPEKKRQILEAAKTSSKSQVAKRYGVSLQTIRNWEKSQEPPATLPEPRLHLAEASRVRELEKLVMRLIEKLDANGLL